MELGNIVSRTVIEPTSLALQANVLTITPASLPDITMLPTPTCLCGSLSENSVQNPSVVRLSRSDEQEVTQTLITVCVLCVC